MKAGEVFDIKLDIDNKLCMVKGKILYWWEEQQIKTDSIYEEPTSHKLVLENSKVFSKTNDKFLISIESEEELINGLKLVDKEILHEMSIKQNKNIIWSNVLHYSSTIPLYQAYLNVSGSSMEQMQDFRKKVMAAYDKTLRAEGFDDFPSPPELIEYEFLAINGVLTRSDLLSMSYAEILKYQTIREIEKRYNEKSTVNMDPNQGFIPFSTPEQAHQAAKHFFPDVVV